MQTDSPPQKIMTIHLANRMGRTIPQPAKLPVLKNIPQQNSYLLCLIFIIIMRICMNILNNPAQQTKRQLTIPETATSAGIQFRQQCWIIAPDI